MNRRSLLVGILSFCVLLGPLTGAGSAADFHRLPITYEEWVREHSQWSAQDQFVGTLNSKFGMDVAEVRLVVTVVKNDEWARHSNMPVRATSSGFKLSTDGRIINFLHHSLSSQGGGGPTISATAQTRLTALLAALPDDESQLPPPDRRLLVEDRVGDRLRSRVYDLADLPDPVIEILRTTESDIRSWVPEFKPDEERRDGDAVQAREAFTESLQETLQYFPSVSGRRAVLMTKDHSLALWDVARRQEGTPLDDGLVVHRVAFSPDESLVAIATGPRTHDGASPHRLRIWNVATEKLIHELRPYEQAFAGPIRVLRWTTDGRYVIAAAQLVSYSSSESLGVWSVAGGRHRGWLSHDKITAMDFDSGYRNLSVQYDDSLIRTWDMKLVLERIDDFEKSLTKSE